MKKKNTTTLNQIFSYGDRVKYNEKNAIFLGYSRANGKDCIVEIDKTFEVEKVDSSQLVKLPKEIDINILDDCEDKSLQVWKNTIDSLIVEYGPTSELHFDAGYNNIYVMLKIK